MEARRKTIGARIVAVLLVLGGAAGLAITCLMILRPQVALLQAMFVGMGLVFVGAGFVGVRLWQGTRGGWRWATLLFAAQIPILTIPGLSWEFYTGLSFRLMHGDPARHLHLGLGGSLEAYLGVQTADPAYGINVVALLVLTYLLVARPRTAPQASPAAQLQP